MLIDGKEIKLRMDLGTMRLASKLTGKNFFAMTEKGLDPDMLSALIYACASRGGTKISRDEVDALSIPQLMELQGDIEKMMTEFMPEGKEAPLVEESRSE